MKSAQEKVNDPDLRAFIRTVGQALLHERRRCGMSQQKAAELVGIEPESISRIENGVIAPTLTRLRQFAIIYSCSLASIVGETSDQVSDIALKLTKELEGLTESDRVFVANQAITTARHIKTLASKSSRPAGRGDRS
jgi:transcriptional regulator with XRE-family HTH domain